MNKNINQRVIDIANHIILTKDTIRKTAVIFNISKSTVHKDIGERLMKLDINKYQEVKKIMLNHLETRHLLGGESTRKLFLRKKQITL